MMLALPMIAWAQQGTVKGRVVDARTGENIEYANVALLKAKDSTLVNGTVSEGNGSFAVTAPYGRYLLRVTFMGYETYFHSQPVTLGDNRKEVNVGKVQMKAHAKTMEAVEISAERSMVEYQLDKRVINVDKNLVTGGGTATDVLEQVPSVAIDNDGNVTLRGSTNVKVLVNGRPSELLASDLSTLLEQIPASTVENVEVITNPSAKYDPEGMSGIINIKLKDKTAGALGLNGVASVNFGAPLPFMVPDSLPSFIPTAMGNISLNYTTEKYNLFLNADLGRRARGNYGVTDIAHRTNGIDYLHDSLHEYSLNPGTMGSVKVGGEYYFNEKNSLLLSYQLRGGSRKRNSWIYAHDLLATVQHAGDVDEAIKRFAVSRQLSDRATMDYTTLTRTKISTQGRGVDLRCHLQRPSGARHRQPRADLLWSCHVGQLFSARECHGERPSGAQRQTQLPAPARFFLGERRLAAGDRLRRPYGLA